MHDQSDPSRDAVHDAIQQHMPMGREAVLTGWVIVAEWMDHHGERWLTKGRAATTPAWSGDGMHHEALYGEWLDDEESDGST
jgi:hypothetical protein